MKINKLDDDFYNESDIQTKNIFDYVKSVAPYSYHFII